MNNPLEELVNLLIEQQHATGPRQALALIRGGHVLIDGVVAYVDSAALTEQSVVVVDPPNAPVRARDRKLTCVAVTEQADYDEVRYESGASSLVLHVTKGSVQIGDEISADVREVGR